MVCCYGTVYIHFDAISRKDGIYYCESEEICLPLLAKKIPCQIRYKEDKKIALLWHLAEDRTETGFLLPLPYMM
ncbi:MAG TPA: hypothetical protein DIW30_00730 [Bacteroidales bacterium]|nr:hypothetical protein [Bacteroidales bacterium]